MSTYQTREEERTFLSAVDDKPKQRKSSSSDADDPHYQVGFRFGSIITSRIVEAPDGSGTP